MRIAMMVLGLAWMGTGVAGSEDEQGENARFSTSLVLPGSCPYSVADEEAALAKGADPSIPGTTVNITSLDCGRLGNHFAIASRFLAVGYCCKAKMVILPPKDEVLAPGMFGEGIPGPRYFDFSDAPDVPGFDRAAECEDDYTAGGEGAYRAFLRTPSYPIGTWNKEAMVACTEKARVLDCEAAYYFPQGMDRCGASSGEEDTDTDADTDHDVDADPHTALAFGKEPRNLVFHIRSGDIFKRKKAYAEYGQPPLSYYTSILNSREWNRVDIVTYADSRGSENIVIPGLRVLIETGSWPRTNITIHTDRDIAVDLQAMLCADALATSRSTLGELTTYHTRASRVYFPSTCDGVGSAFGLTPAALIAYRSRREEHFEVFGLGMKQNAPRYHLYDDERIFEDQQRLEMLQYEGVAGVVNCTA